MKSYWRRIQARLTPGVGDILWLLAVAGAVVLVCRWTGAAKVDDWLGASQNLWRGQVWRLVTYALLPGDGLGFLINLVALALVGPIVERQACRIEFLQFCGWATLGGGLVAAMLLPAGAAYSGSGPLMFALFVAWWGGSGTEPAIIPVFGFGTLRELAWALVVINLIMAFIAGGWRSPVILIGGGFAGWLYLRLTQKRIRSRPSRAVVSERISRLEL